MNAKEAAIRLIETVDEVDDLPTLRDSIKKLSKLVLALWEDSSSCALEDAGMDIEDIDDEQLEADTLKIARVLGIAVGRDEEDDLVLPGFVIDAAICYQAYVIGRMIPKGGVSA